MGERGLISPIVFLLAGLALAGAAQSQGWCENRQLQPGPVSAGEVRPGRPQPRNDDPTVGDCSVEQGRDLTGLCSARPHQEQRLPRRGALDGH